MDKAFSTPCLYSLTLSQYLLLFFLILKFSTAFMNVNPVC